MNHTLSDSQLEAMIKSAVNSSGPLPPDEKFSQLISALRELQERRKAAMDGEPYGYVHQSVYEQSGSCGLSNDHEAYRDSKTHIPLYRHAQQPVVPDGNFYTETQKKVLLEAANVLVTRKPTVTHGYLIREVGRIAIRALGRPQPAPVVPDVMEPTIEAIKRILPTSNPDEYAACIGADMWNACRATMLNGGRS
ncbi:TPA: hypothetical protein RQO68_005527 [Klebsiella michiganensis]|nr:hypothetical protein [Klebsiella michiganensis]